MADAPIISEGGGKLPGFGEDFLQRIVGVNWPRKPGGLPSATFVFGGFGSDFFGTGGVLTVKVNKVKVQGATGIGGSEAKYELEKSIVFISLADNFEPVTSSYAVVEQFDPVTRTIRRLPTFLVAGNQANVFTNSAGGQSARVNLQIYCSNDGLSWSNVFNQEPVVLDDFGGGFFGNPVSLVWEPVSKAFYFDACTFTGTITDTILSDTVFSSSDGRSWGEISRTNTGNASDYVSAYPSSYCSQNDCIEEFTGNHVPDGVMKDDPVEKMRMRPQQPPIRSYGQGSISFEFSSGDVTYGNDVVEIWDAALLQGFSASIPGIPKVFCVAGVHGIWMVGGSADPGADSGALAVSIDKGKTWTPFQAPQGAILTMVAGAY